MKLYWWYVKKEIIWKKINSESKQNENVIYHCTFDILFMLECVVFEILSLFLTWLISQIKE